MLRHEGAPGGNAQMLAVCLMEKQETMAEGKKEGRLQLISEALLRESGWTEMISPTQGVTKCEATVLLESICKMSGIATPHWRSELENTTVSLDHFKNNFVK